MTGGFLTSSTSTNLSESSKSSAILNDATELESILNQLGGGKENIDSETSETLSSISSIGTFDF